MKDQELTDQGLYRFLGIIFYAIAASDGNVRKEESLKLVTMLGEQWEELLERQDLKTISRTFKSHLDAHKNAEEAFDEFMEFKAKHPDLFTDVIKKKILKTAHAIAASFSGKNKSELILLAKLGIKLR